MNGEIVYIGSGDDGREYGFIKVDDPKLRDFYFDDRYLPAGKTMSDYYKGDKVIFEPIFNERRNIADNVIYIEEVQQSIAHMEKNEPEPKDIQVVKKASSIQLDPNMYNPWEESNNEHKDDEIIEYYKPGLAKYLDKEKIQKVVKEDSGEYEVIAKLKNVLYIPYVGTFNMGHNNIFPFCLIGTTRILKRFIHEKSEFLLVFSHFKAGDWQQSTLKVAQNIRKKKEIADRRPLVYFYVLISNAKNLINEINKVKGGTEAAVIPFTFEEILNTKNNKDLTELIQHRFDEYVFENNMLGEENPIDNDALLFGDRGKIADAIVQRCVEGKFSGIFGLRRSGKSSVLRAVIRRLDTAGIKYISIESRSQLETLKSWKLALYYIARAVRIATSGLEQNDNERRVDFDKRLNLNSTVQDYENSAALCFVEDVKFYTRNENTFVIAIDEIELITYNTATSAAWKDLEAYKSFWGALRDSGCSIIVCGVNSSINEKSIIEFKGQTCDNPMYERIHNAADFSKTYLPAFTDLQTKYMINTLGSYSGIAFDNVYANINKAFGGQPYAIRQFCSYVFESVKHLRKKDQVYEISMPIFDQLLMEFNRSAKGEALFQTILQHIVIYKSEYEMLIKMAHSPEMYKQINPNELSLIDHLEKYGLIEYDQTSRYVTFNIASIRDYICRNTNKSPDDMNNEERMSYIQQRVRICEKKLKEHIKSYYSLTGSEEEGIKILAKFIKPKKGVDISSLQWADYFDHDKFNFYFSSLMKIISSEWATLGKKLEKRGVSNTDFVWYMTAMNAGRTDADHYDPEDNSAPEEWEIDNETMKRFSIAYDALIQAL